MDAMDAIRQTYFQECEELLVAMEEGLLAMESGEADSETINAVFRAVHSIKGGGGAFGFDALVDFAHTFETVLDNVRAGKLAADSEVVKLLLKAGDLLADHVGAARDGRELPEDWGIEVSQALAALEGNDKSGYEAEAPAEFEGLAFTPRQISVDENVAPACPRWRIRFAPHAALYAKANEPALLIRELRSLGAATVEADISQLPELASLEPEQAYLSWTITLDADVQQPAIEEVFEFVAGDCDLAIEKADHRAAVDAVAPFSAPIASALEANASAAVVPEKREIAAQQGETTIKPTIRVDLDKVDRLVNLVGELVITQAVLTQRIHESGLVRTSLVGTGLAELEHLLRELQEGVMAIRTQPVKSVFQRMPRLVRELAAQTSKQVRLVVQGEATEVDKTVIERLGEPLTHMIRNAIDHGLEVPEQRVAAGKPPEGTVTLSAEHRGGRIVIEVSDDGRGIDRERVRAKAIENGIIASHAVLSDEETDNLIFMPGFSTASHVSNISGRGVGMDVVRRNIVDLGGRIVISSQAMKGSKFSLTLPLTLAVLDGMVVTAGGQTFVLPLSHIVESLRPKPADICPFGKGRFVLRNRNGFVPLARVAHMLGLPESQREPGGGVVILVESQGTGKLALGVDAIVGQRQVVIKSFEDNYRRIEGIAAATILGDGRVALILDVDGLVARSREGMPARSAATPAAGFQEFQEAVGQ